MFDEPVIRRLFIGLAALQLLFAVLNLAYIPSEHREFEAWKTHIESPIPEGAVPATAPQRLGPARELIRFAKQQLDLDRECNLTTWFSSMQAALVAFLALLLWFATGRRGWVLVSLGIVMLSADEVCQGHEWLGTYLSDSGFDIGAMKAPYPWVVVLGPLFLAYAVAVLAFLNRELAGEKRLKRLTLIGMCMMMASLPLEAIGGQFQGLAPRPPRIEVIIEETSESMGMTLFLYVILLLVSSEATRRRSRR